MGVTYGLGDIKKYTRGGKRKRKMDEPKVCRICGELWWPRTGPAAGKRDVCYRPECEAARDAERRAKQAARKRKKRREKK